jgi:hypothetical protein
MDEDKYKKIQEIYSMVYGLFSHVCSRSVQASIGGMTVRNEMENT